MVAVVNAPAAHAVGMDVGASFTKIGLVEAGGRLAAHGTISSNLRTGSPEPFLAAACRLVAELAAGRPLRGIGVSLCSVLNEEHSGALLSVNAPDLNGWDIRTALQARFGCPVNVMNDVNAYLLAEYHFGNGQGARRLLCLALGTGLSIASMTNGCLIETWGGIAADAGRVILAPEAEARCNGGVRGSAEALCGAAAIERAARARYGREDISARDVIAAAREGSDPLAAALMAEAGGYLGQLLAILSPIFFPQRILVTGGMAEAGEPLLGAIRKRYATLIGDYMAGLNGMESGEIRPVEICKGALGPEAAVLGSTAQFFQVL